ncbi:transcriptional regulator, LysR family [Streptoalloteichus tenebrarius]|uniref:Transcriptional regulator, LysR family n=1 Tax=Streptoalloteichus tenebrarius (strain ATCC 17920 / DSM 40477 / JCM 4838 / CBS 697.72 / NBRC 16177 / NCIMB 11028 / NRRL B-12390 / A12253. 1 / ISP 5477) TaxID=1933 RepID=A0ABT1I0B0_STRSD|nr:LysR family transcriptional regulator [Streptoalloteichus tenebrarius]MCP2261188.1 transcriptional regulator, LysR family [Streptoalloteichus tenebrarius]BFF02953.1 LysR family transcriptional regulator [Streptoalloteichus tenebrarius]
MQSVDLNLLVALDALLEEESVTGAAERLHLSAPAMSRTLARIRATLGDPVLVRAGRRLVPTPRALAIRQQVRAALQEAMAVLRPADQIDLASLRRTFVIRANDAMASMLALPLSRRTRTRAPGVTLRFAAEGEEDVAALRDGRIDLDVGLLAPLGPEVRTETLYVDEFVTVVRAGHPLTEGALTPQRFVEYPHVSVSRRGRATGPLDDALRELGLTRTVSLVVPNFATALAVVAESDLVATMLGRIAASSIAPERFSVLPLPVRDRPIVVGQAWHPRMDADPAHRWLREQVAEVCRNARLDD